MRLSLKPTHSDPETLDIDSFPLPWDVVIRPRRATHLKSLETIVGKRIAAVEPLCSLKHKALRRVAASLCRRGRFEEAQS